MSEKSGLLQYVNYISLRSDLTQRRKCFGGTEGKGGKGDKY